MQQEDVNASIGIDSLDNKNAQKMLRPIRVALRQLRGLMRS
jgi:hypothetical protein